MPERYLLGYVLPTPISLLMQGIAEGATIALLGLFVGDRLIEPHSRKSGIAFLLLLCVGILLREWQAAPTGAEAVGYSRRNLLTVASLLFLGVVATFNIAFYIRNPAHRLRMRGMGGRYSGDSRAVDPGPGFDRCTLDRPGRPKPRKSRAGRLGHCPSRAHLQYSCENQPAAGHTIHCASSAGIDPIGWSRSFGLKAERPQR
jgi:hypothetical protein